MIFYSNSDLTTPHMTFIGRWVPFHKGHENLIVSKSKQHPETPIMIQIRATNEEYSVLLRAEIIKAWMINNTITGSIVLIPNVEGVYYGRGVGYKIEYVDVDADMKKISATGIRSKIKSNDQNWKSDIPKTTCRNMLNKSVSSIVESGLVVWLTGCPSAGKTTIANHLESKIKAHYPFIKTQLLDGDVMRASPISINTGFSTKERNLHIIKMGFLCKMFADHGILVIASFVSPNREARNQNMKLIGINRFVEVYVKASKKTRTARDTKGLYKKAAAGEITNLTGINSPYQVPSKPKVVCNTNVESISESVNSIFSHIFSE